MAEYRIWKYDVTVTTPFFQRMPIGANILSVQVQHEQPQIWALVDPLARTEKRDFRVFGTGHTVNDADATMKLHYIGTFQLHGGDFVGHLFEIGRAK